MDGSDIRMFSYLEHHAGVFWLHITAFAIYNGLIGYLLVHGENNNTTKLVLYCSATAAAGCY